MKTVIFGAALLVSGFSTTFGLVTVKMQHYNICEGVVTYVWVHWREEKETSIICEN